MGEEKERCNPDPKLVAAALSAAKTELNFVIFVTRSDAGPIDRRNRV